jgi:four helix bundle suffix protein
MSDQMVQAARSGRQNIAEGSRAAATSSQTELRLVNVARASLEELLLDYEDFLRHRCLKMWAVDAPEALAVRQIGRDYRQDGTSRTDPSNRTDRKNETVSERYALYAQWLDNGDPAVRANALICLINQATYLLDKQIEGLEAQFVDEGGYSEQLAVKRLAKRAEDKRGRTDPSDQTDRTVKGEQAKGKVPDCPKCGKPMALRTAQKGNRSGKQFWGCSGYPECKGIVGV